MLIGTPCGLDENKTPAKFITGQRRRTLHLTYSFFYSFRRAALAKYKCHYDIILSILPCVYNCLYFLIIIKGFIYFDWSCGAVWHSVWHCTRICRISKLGSVLSGTPEDLIAKNVGKTNCKFHWLPQLNCNRKFHSGRAKKAMEEFDKYALFP